MVRRQRADSRPGCRASLLLIRLQLHFNAVVNPVRVPPFHGINGDPVQEHGEVQMVAARQAGLATVRDHLTVLDLLRLPSRQASSR